AGMMLELAAEYPEYRENAARVELVETTSSAYYGAGYQDVQNRVPKIDNTVRDLGWKPQVNMEDALRGIFDAYRTHVAEARELVARTSALEHSGIRTLLYGTLLPGPDIGRSCADTLRGVRDAGFEVGIHSYDHVLWQDNVAAEDRAWTQAEMSKAVERFNEIF